MSNHFFDAVMDRSADDTAFLRTPAGECLTYGELRSRVVDMASALRTLGLEAGGRVAAQIEKSPTGLVLYLATLYAGGCFLPLNTGYTANELAYFLDDAEPTIVVCDPLAAEAIAPLTAAKVETLDGDGCGSLRDRADAASPMAPVARSADDLAAILYTSGTTGRSKGAMLTHGNLASNAAILCEAWRFSGEDCLLHALPIYHTHGLFVACNCVLLSGARMIFMAKFDTLEVLRHLPDITVLMGVPTFYTRLLDDPRLTHDVTKDIRLFISGSAPLLAETHRAWQERTGHAILERYGMTETNMNCSNPYDGERRAGTVGFPLPGVDLRITDPETGTALGREAVGMIEVKGPNVFEGYWRNPEKTAQEFREDGHFITGDLGRIDADGYVHISGRSKDLIISGGFNVYPKEIEDILDAIDGVRESAVIGVPHKDFGEGVTAVVVPETGRTLSDKDILAALAGKLAKFKQPKRVLFVADLPRNAMGKVQKNVLREAMKSTYD